MCNCCGMRKGWAFGPYLKQGPVSWFWLFASFSPWLHQPQLPFWYDFSAKKVPTWWVSPTLCMNYVTTWVITWVDFSWNFDMIFSANFHTSCIEICRPCLDCLKIQHQCCIFLMQGSPLFWHWNHTFFIAIFCTDMSSTAGGGDTSSTYASLVTSNKNQLAAIALSVSFNGSRFSPTCRKHSFWHAQEHKHLYASLLLSRGYRDLHSIHHHPFVVNSIRFVSKLGSWIIFNASDYQHFCGHIMMNTKLCCHCFKTLKKDCICTIFKDLFTK